MRVRGSHLEEDVGRVEVAVADAHAVDVRHARRDVEQDAEAAAPVQARLVGAKEAIADRVPEAPAVAVLLQEVELEDALLHAHALGLRDVAQVVRVRGHHVAVRHVARDRGLRRHERRVRVVRAALEHDRLHRHGQAVPLACTHALLLSAPGRSVTPRIAMQSATETHTPSRQRSTAPPHTPCRGGVHADVKRGAV